MTKHLTDVRFSDLNLEAPILQGLEEAGFEFCTPIQAESLPHALEGRDVAGQAQTGTGKTIAFLLAAFNYMLTKEPAEGRKPTQPRAVMLAPTRELAIQIHKDALQLATHLDFRIGLVYGGTGYEKQKAFLEKGVDILIGTPGRLIDYLKQGVYDFRAVDISVMDEADRMFDLGFIDDIRYVLRRMPPAKERLSLLYSATLSHRVGELAYDFMDDPVEVKVTPEDTMTLAQINETIYYPANDEKLPLLVGLLRKSQATRSMVFINTKREAERIYCTLAGNGFKAEMLSGDVPQNKREKLLGMFSSGEIEVLIATDVAARGLHIPDVSHVYNYDLPQDQEDYVHRIGRTGRAGASGEAISFACERFAFSLGDIEKFIQHKIPVASITDDLLPKLEPPIPSPFAKKRDARGRPVRGQRNDRRSQRQSSRKPDQERKPRREPKKEIEVPDMPLSEMKPRLEGDDKTAIEHHHPEKNKLPHRLRGIEIPAIG